MNKETQNALLRSEECLSDAQFCFEASRYLVCVNRAYYTVFDATRALLFSEGVFAKTHQGIQVKFSEIFVKTQIFSIEYNTIFKQLAELREIGDYDLDADIDQKDCVFALNAAQKFLNRTKEYLEEKQNLTFHRQNKYTHRKN